MEYTISVNQKKAVEWELSMGEAIMFSYLSNIGQWAHVAPGNPEFRWMSSSKLATELPLVCTHPGSARRHMAQLEKKGLIVRITVGNKSYFKITGKGIEWRSDTAGANESVRPEKKGKPNGSDKPNESVEPNPNESVERSVNQSLSNNQGSGYPTPAARTLAKKPVAKSTNVWKSYSEAYERRHGAPPLRDAAVNSLLCRLVDSMGEEDAIQVAAFFLTQNNSFYVNQRHPVRLLYADRSKLHTEWQTGLQMTSTQAREVDRTQTNVSNMQAVIAKRKAEGKM